VIGSKWALAFLRSTAQYLRPFLCEKDIPYVKRPSHGKWNLLRWYIAAAQEGEEAGLPLALLLEGLADSLFNFGDGKGIHQCSTEYDHNNRNRRCRHHSL
jgi:hypothetical protein